MNDSLRDPSFSFGAGQVAPGHCAGGRVANVVMACRGQRIDGLHAPRVIRHYRMGNHLSGSIFYLDVCGETKDVVTQRLIAGDCFPQYRPGSSGAEISFNPVRDAAAAGKGSRSASCNGCRRVVILQPRLQCYARIAEWDFGEDVRELFSASGRAQ
jgi:hypothetical protein